MLRHFNDFAKSLRLKYSRAHCRKKSRKLTKPLPPTSTATIHRQMKFLPPTNPDTVVTRYSGLSKVENYIDNTKQSIVDNLTDTAKTSTSNFTAMQEVVIQKLKKVRHTGTIKPADKNLGAVLMNTDDYVTQCLAKSAKLMGYEPTMLELTDEPCLTVVMRQTMSLH